MKNILNKKFSGIVAVMFLMLLSSCNKLDGIRPVFNLDQDRAIVDAASAQNVLNGVYIQLREFAYASTHINTFSKMGITQDEGFSGADDLDLNQPQINNSSVSSMYTVFYKTIQEANVFLFNIGNVDAALLGGDAAKNSFIAEARFLRGLSHFYLLRAFGQHYDTSSTYGISLRETPALDNTAIARSNVADSYASITADFEYAIANATSNEKFRVSVVAATAMLAKVKLYEGDFARAATLAESVINNPAGRVFADPYVNNFSPSGQDGIDSPELIFGPFANDQNAESINITNNRYFNSVYNGIGQGDPRYGTSKGSTFSFGPSGFVRNAPTHVHMRLSEVYLIHAEAAARAGTGVDAAALASLNAIRTRSAVGLPAAAPADKAALIEAIRVEKILELYAETGEEFFDLVRFAALDGFDPSSVKPTMNNPDFYILPIPFSEFEISGVQSVVVQNPGYPTSI